MFNSEDKEILESMKYLLVPQADKIRFQSLPYDAKKNFWLPNEKLGFIACEIQSEKGDDVTVKDANNVVSKNA